MGFSHEWALIALSISMVIVLQMKIESSHDAVHLTVFSWFKIILQMSLYLSNAFFN